MTSALSTDHPSGRAPASAVAAGEIVGRHHVDLRSARWRSVAIGCFAAYVLVLLGVTFLPLPGAAPAGTAGAVPIDLTLSRPNLLSSWESQRNVLMTIPLGLLLPVVARWRYELLLLACVGAPLAIESGQLVVSTLVGWAWRSADVNDVFHNTVGALVGLSVTGAALALTGGLSRPSVWRLLPGVLPAALLAWAAVSTVTAPTLAPMVGACDETPDRAVTRLSHGFSAYAGDGGSLCVLSPDGNGVSLVPDVGTGVVFTAESGGSRIEVGVLRPGATPPTDETTLDVHEVEGSSLRLWVEARAS